MDATLPSGARGPGVPFAGVLSRLFDLLSLLAFLAFLAALGAAIFGRAQPTVTRNLRFAPTSVSIDPQSDDQIKEAKLTSLVGTVAVTFQQRLPFPERLLGTLPQLTHFFFGWALLHLAYRLCRNVRDGEMFSPSNLRLVRGLGLTLIAYSVVAGVCDGWFHFHRDQPGGETLIVEGLAVGAPRTLGFGTYWMLHFSGRLFLTGLLVLILTHVFQRGLELKRENDLTV
jgi:hypothetical protein